MTNRTNWLHRTLPVVLVGGLLALPVVTAANAAESTQQDVAPRAKVELEIKAGKSTIKFDPQTLDLGEEGKFVVDQDDHRYELRARVEETDGQKVKVVLAYTRDSEKVFDDVELKLKLDGKAATKPSGKSKIKVRVRKGEPKQHRIDMPEGDDPLTGI
jgi:hypothetical protein